MGEKKCVNSSKVYINNLNILPLYQDGTAVFSNGEGKLLCGSSSSISLTSSAAGEGRAAPLPCHR